MEKVGLLCGVTAMGIAEIKLSDSFFFFFKMKKCLAICIHKYCTANAIEHSSPKVPFVFLTLTSVVQVFVSLTLRI